MNRDQKAAVIEQVATQIKESEAVFAVDYRGISVPQAAELRERLGEAEATLRVVKNTLTERAADQAGAEDLKGLLDGPTAFTFVRGDAALAAKVLATFRREHQLLEFKGGTMDGATLSVDEIEAIAKLPARDVLHGQLVGVLASPVTGLVRGLNQLIQGLALQLGQIAEQGLVGGADAEEAPAAEDAPAAAQDAPAAGGEDAPPAEGAPVAGTEEAPPAEDAPAGDSGNAPTEGEDPADDAPGDGDDAPAGEAPPEQAAGDESPPDETSGDEPADNDENDAPAEGDDPKEG